MSEMPPPLKDGQTMDRLHTAFYQEWRKNWQRGIKTELAGQYVYLFPYMNELLNSLFASINENIFANIDSVLSNYGNCNYQEALSEFSRLIEAYHPPIKSSVYYYMHKWASDCCVMMKDYQQAIEIFPELSVGGRSSSNTESLLSLKLALGKKISGRDILTLYGPQVTAFGKKHIETIASYLDVAVSVYERENNTNLLAEWSKSCHKAKNYFVFIGTQYGYFASQLVEIPHFSFSYVFNSKKDDFGFIRRITREAENIVREEEGLPRVNEGWVSETELFYAIKRELVDFEVHHHASPDWLGKQHLDIFIPALQVAIEYQGLQHDQPVAFFGGEEAFEKNKERDARKLRLCKRNGIKLIYVRPGYELTKLLEQIRAEIE